MQPNECRFNRILNFNVFLPLKRSFQILCRNSWICDYLNFIVFKRNSFNMWLHHLNLRCCNIVETKKKFIESFTFREYGYLQVEDNPGKEEIVLVLRHKDVFITVQESKDINFDTIDDIAFCVDSVFELCNCTEIFGGKILKCPQKLECNQYKLKEYKKCWNCFNGSLAPCLYSVERAVIKSPIGNIKHTVFDKRNFSGVFLPGFVQTNFDDDFNSSAIQGIDHVALAVGYGESMDHITWYQECLKLLRYKTHTTENKQGLVIMRKNGDGLRLLSLVEHPCSENSLIETTTVKETEMKGGKLKLVFCESLSCDRHDQILTFIQNHQGPGVQHVAFTTDSIIDDAQMWQEQGVEFISPPLGYYTQIKGTLMELEEKHNENAIRQYGILIDAEKRLEQSEKDGYLHQVFTKPVLKSKTFFFELIQRDNANGFGAGNVRALWNALDSSLNGESKSS